MSSGVLIWLIIWQDFTCDVKSSIDAGIDGCNFEGTGLGALVPQDVVLVMEAEKDNFRAGDPQ